MKFKSWLATLIIGSNIVLPCNNTYSLRTTGDFIEASRLTANKLNEQPEGVSRLSFLYELLLHMFGYVAFCEHEGLDPEGFLLGLVAFAPEQIKKKDILSGSKFKISDKFRLNLLLPGTINLHTANTLLSTILRANPDQFNQMFLVNPGHTADDILSALTVCSVLRTAVLNVQSQETETN